MLIGVVAVYILGALIFAAVAAVAFIKMELHKEDSIVGNASIVVFTGLMWPVLVPWILSKRKKTDAD